MFLVQQTRSKWLRYGTAALCVVLAVAFRVVFLADLGTRASFLTFYPAVMLAALYGGFRPGLLATVLSMFCATFWIEPPLLTDYADWMSMAVFFGSCAMFSYIAEAMRRAQARASEAEAQAEILAEREKAAVALQQSEDRFRLIAETIDDAFWMSTPTVEKVLYVSPAFERIWGRTKESLYESPQVFIESLHPEDREMIQCRINEAHQGAFECDYRIHRPDGSIRWIHDRGFPVLDEQGNTSLLVGVASDVTEKKQVEQALRENEERFRTLADNMSQFAWTADEKGWIFWYNKRWLDYTGTTLEEMQGWGWKKVHDPEHVNKVIEKFQHSLDTGEPWEDVFPLRGKDGAYRWFLSRALPIHDESGRIRRWFGTNTDITEQLKIQEALRASEEKLRLALDAARMGTWDWNIQTGSLVWSERSMRLCGLDPEAPVSYKRFMEILHPEDRERIETAIAHALKNGRDYEEEERVVWPDGSIHWLLSKGRVYRDDSGNPLRMSGTAFDITKRKEMENDLLRSKEEWERTFDSVPDMILIIDNLFKVIRVNRAMAERLGMKRKEITGLPCYEVLHASHFPPAFCPHAQLLKDGKEHVVEIHEDRLGGDFLVSVTPLRDEKGRMVGTVHVARDITERKRMQEALEKRLVALKRPLDSAEELAFEDLFNLEEIQTLQDRFAEACGVASLITRVDGTPITNPSNFCRLCRDIIRTSEKGRQNCHCSDAVIGRHNPQGPNIQPCLSGGLWDAGASITVGGKHIANWLVGQVRNEAQTESKMREYARRIGVDEEELVSAFREVPSMSLDQFERVAQSLFTLAGELSSMAYQNVQQARFITERKQMEDALRKSRDELELRVHERTAELQRTYDALRQSEEKYRELVENANSIVLRWDAKGRIAFINEYAQELFGYKEDEILGRHVVGTIVPETESSGRDLAAMIDGIIRDPGRYAINENENVRKNGDRVWVSWTNKAIYDESGALSGVLSIGNDITARKRAEVALARASRALMTLSKCNEALVRAGSEEELLAQICIILVEEGGYRMAWFGYAEHGLGKAVRPVSWAGYNEGYLEQAHVTWADTERGKGPVGCAIRTGKVHVSKNVRDNPEMIPWRKEALKRGYGSSIALPLIVEGATVGALTIYAPEPDAFDEDEMKLLADLAEDVSYGIASLRMRAEREKAQERLRIYTARLEQRNRELEDFTFISSHHVQEPLRKILTFSDRLKIRCGDALHAEAEDYLDRLQKSVVWIQTLVQDLLRYSKIGGEIQNFAPVDLSEVLQEVLLELEPSIEEAGARVLVSNLPAIDAERTQIRKLFSHLLENTLKFRGKNAPVIEVSSRLTGHGKMEFAEIFFADNGIGFDEKYLDRIFTPFQQLHGKARYEGTGMGLAICRRIVELHGGSITARSTPGEGATFIVRLPVHQETREDQL